MESKNKHVSESPVEIVLSRMSSVFLIAYWPKYKDMQEHFHGGSKSDSENPLKGSHMSEITGYNLMNATCS